MATNHGGEEGAKDGHHHVSSTLSISTSSCHDQDKVCKGGFETEPTEPANGSDVWGSLSLPSTPTAPSGMKSPRRRRWSFVREREKWKDEEDRSVSGSNPAIDIPACDSVDFNFNSATAGSGNSPVSNWGISSPGDDPKEVKARLKEWAHAVALVSTSPH